MGLTYRKAGEDPAAAKPHSARLLPAFEPARYVTPHETVLRITRAEGLGPVNGTATCRQRTVCQLGLFLCSQRQATSSRS